MFQQFADQNLFYDGQKVYQNKISVKIQIR